MYNERQKLAQEQSIDFNLNQDAEIVSQAE